VRCPRCGNENSEANRFCGMCGATLLSAPPPLPPRKTSPMSAVPAPEVSRPHIVEPSRTPASEPGESPVSSGPSFLGLNDPAPSKRADLSLEPTSPGKSRNLDYLLEDDEPPKGGGGWTMFVLILLALALAAGLGYWRYKDHALGWLHPKASKPLASTTNSNDDGAVSPAPADTTATGPQGSTTNKSAATPPAATDSAPASGTTPNADSSTNPPASSAPMSSANNNPAAPADAAANTPTDATKAADQPKTADQPAAQPSPPAKPAKPFDAAAESDKYLYGHGVRQDCDRGLRMLKPAANQGNAKAMMEMGGLYSSGTCVPRDLPTAYRWYALTLRKEPDNQAAQSEVQKLWGEMTQPERKLAIQLTQ
jgi:hypothetical protein